MKFPTDTTKYDFHLIDLDLAYNDYHKYHYFSSTKNKLIIKIYATSALEYKYNSPYEINKDLTLITRKVPLKEHLLTMFDTYFIPFGFLFSTIMSIAHIILNYISIILNLSYPILFHHIGMISFLIAFITFIRWIIISG